MTQLAIALDQSPVGGIAWTALAGREARLAARMRAVLFALCTDLLLPHAGGALSRRVPAESLLAR